ncbi:MAG: hypothetical protein HND47_07460 [Chloroflexi bacterium]|nr:hypothetical protein [Chloroflexota bacterium]
MNRRDRYIAARMTHDVGENLKNFLGHLRRKRRLRLDYLFSAFGVFYGAVRWRATQARKGS